MRKIWIGLAVFAGVLIIFFTAASLLVWVVSGKDTVISGDKVALISIEGILLDARQVVDQLRKYEKHSAVKAIVLRIESPGGGVVPAQEIYEEIRRIRSESEKKIVASMGSIAASGGYYVACAADRIVANPGTITGSIGVKMEFSNLEELLKKIGIRSTVIKSGKLKDLGSPMREMTEEEKTLLQEVIVDVHSQFVEVVVQGRRLNEEAVRALADGRIFSGRQAKDLGLVDNLGTLQDTIKLAAELAGIEGEPRVITEHRRPTWVDLLKGELFSALRGEGVQPAAWGMQYVYAP
jgi:protease-4